MKGKGNTLSKFGGTCSIIVGISYIVAGGSYLLVPAEQKAVSDAGAFLTSYAQNPLMSRIEEWAFALGAILALAVVLAISEKVRPADEGWVRWTSNIALIGFAVTALQYFRYLAFYPERAAAYVAGDAATKVAIAANQSLVAIDPHYWLVFGGVGLWFLVVNLLALREKLWPSLLAYVGIAGAAAYGLVVAGFVFKVELFITAAAAAAIILGPIWFIWAGMILRKTTS